MLTRSTRRLAGLRCTELCRAAVVQGLPVKKQAFGYGDVAPAGAPGFGGDHQLAPPETVQNTVKYISQNMTNLPKYKEIIEGIGYPGQRHSAGGLCTIGRIYYGPGRYDYGRPKRPQSWFANFFYPFWEFGHLMFVADRWVAWRMLRHILGVFICYIPFNLQMNWNKQMIEDYKKGGHEW
eukprot:TRINITY_DN15086_c0_g1_i3.p1 TRINITY_DN15086_c0_g1~~TRINITY_DN15086_c0_g1_i3.p1  ORF type:complete len:180 (-),score=31.75 TRINITY_DN15086_c0_g1_i3:113-652(-)